MTNSWTDIQNTDLAIIMGGNAAEAHPCGFKWVTEAKANRGAKLIVVDPRFTRSAAVADFYAPIRQGTDIAFLLGVISYCIRNDKVQWDYVKAFTNAPYLIKEGFGYADGLFTGYDETRRDYDRSTWNYELGADGYVISDDTLQHPRCVWQLLKKHASIFTPEMVERICGTPKEKFLKVCEMIGECSSKTKTMTSMYALGWTQHSSWLAEHPHHGDAAAHSRQYRRARRRHERVARSFQHPGPDRPRADVEPYSRLSDDTADKEPTLDIYMSTRGFKPLRPDQTSYWQNYKKFFVSFQKAMWGDAATAENDFAYDWLPKLDVPGYDILRAFQLMHEGKMNGYFCQGFNPLLSAPNRRKITTALSKLKFLVVMDPLQTETARFWENYGEHNDVDSSSIQTEVIELPTTCFAEETGSLVNSGRWLQWHWAGGTPPGEAKHDNFIMGQIFLRLRALYQKEGGTVPEPIVNLDWRYKDPGEPKPEELAKELNGYANEDITDPNDPTKVVIAKGKQLVNFSVLRDDGKTTCGCWIYSGCFNEAGNNMARRDNTDPDNAGVFPNWAWSWPLNRRVLYNRASADVDGNPWDPSRKLLWWDGSKWTGYDVPDIAPNAKPNVVGPFIMNAEGTGAPVHARTDARRTVPGSLRAVRIAGRQCRRAENSGQSGGARVPERSATIRRCQGVSLRGDVLSAHRTLPFLDQTRPLQRGDAAGVLRRNFRATREGKGN